MSIFNVRDYGAAGNGVQDDFPAFRRTLDAIDVVNTSNTSRGAILFIPSGKYLLKRTLNISRNMILQGAGQASSILEFVPDPDLPSRTPSPGIIVEREQRPDGTTTIGDWTIIWELAVQAPNSFFPPANLPTTPTDDDDTLFGGTSSGIVLYTKAAIENCFVGGFEHDGIHINTSAGLGRNANSWQVRNCFVQFNGRHGLFVSGGDANAGCAINLVAQTNCRWGVYDRSFLGNTYLACLMEANGHINAGPHDPHPSFGGAYRTPSPTGQHVLLGCYSEGDQISRIIFPTMVVGGVQGSVIERDLAAASFPVVILNSGNAEVDDLTVHGPISTQVRSVGLIATHDSQPIDPLDSVILVNAESNQPGFFGPVPLTLPPLNDPKIIGRRYTIKRVDAAMTPLIPGTTPVTISVAPGAAEKIDGASSIDLVQPFSWVTLLASVKSTALADEPNWYVIGKG